MKVIYAALVLFSASAFADGARVVICSAIGTRSEGYYSAAVVESKLMGFDNCAADKSRKPKCVNQNTRSEGWLTPDGRLHFDNCSEKYVLCRAQGTRSEGWYAVTIDENDKTLIGFASCADAP